MGMIKNIPFYFSYKYTYTPAVQKTYKIYLIDFLNTGQLNINQILMSNYD